MTDWKKHNDLQQALLTYLALRKISLTGREEYSSGIDCVFVRIDGNPVFIIGLPPLSNYEVEETEHTHKYLRPQTAVAA